MAQAAEAARAESPNGEMRAICNEKYGAPREVLKLKRVKRPALEAGRVLVRIRAASTHAGDWHLIRGTPFFIRLMFGGVFTPGIRIPGCEMSGIVEEVAEDVRELFQVGDEVFGDLSANGASFGAFAEYVSVPAGVLVSKPSNVSAEQAAAACTSALTALQAVRDAVNIQESKNTAGESSSEGGNSNDNGKESNQSHGKSQVLRVLVNGASGGVGCFAVQLAKSFGAHVTAVCHPSKAHVVSSWGADAVVDYTAEDVTKTQANNDESNKFDAVIDAACFRSPLEYVRVMKKGGRLIVIGGATSRFFQTMVMASWMSRRYGVHISCLESKPNQKDLLYIRDALASGVIVPHIDKVFTLEQTAEAVAYVEERKVTGKVVITI